MELARNIVSRNGFFTAAIVASVGISVALISSRSKGCSNANPLFGNEETVLELLELERTGSVHAPAVTTITFFNGPLPEQFLRKRIEELVMANPWLDSRLIDVKDRGGVCAVYDSKSPSKLTHFQVVRGMEINRGWTYSRIASSLRPFGIPVGRDCVNRLQSLFLVTLIELDKNKSGSDYAIVVSLSHTLGDGHTYYRIYSMLSKDTEIVSLQASREGNYMAELLKLQGTKFGDWLKSPIAIMGFLGNLVYGLIFGPPSVTMIELDSNKINILKKQSLADNNGFLSSNDIITSSFFGCCKGEFDMMALNFRNRIPIITDRHAGNYEGILVYNTKDGSDPNEIRKSLDVLKKDRTRIDYIPSILQSLRSRCVVASNWSTFYEDIGLPESELLDHWPCMDPKDSIFYDVIVIFKLSNCRLGLLYCGRSHSATSFASACRQLFSGCFILPTD